MRVLVIAPHLDDEVLGAGGAILHHVAAGDEVHVCFVANRAYGHIHDAARMEKELACARAAQQVLGYREFHFLNLPDERLDACVQEIIIPLERVHDALRPAVAYSPYPWDNNQDHRAVAAATQVVCRPAATPALGRWLFYEVPSSTEQAPRTGAPVFAPTVYLDVAATLERKHAALACYDSETRPYPHPRSREGLRALAMVRGMEAGLAYAEAFMLVREKVGACG